MMRLDSAFSRLQPSVGVRLKQINSEIVNAVPQLEKVDSRPIKGSNLFPELYSNIFLCARKKSGKTSTIFKIIKECSGQNTTILAFVSTLYKDANWKTIRKYCEIKKIPFVGYTSMEEDGINHLGEFVNSHQTPENETEPEEPSKAKGIVKFDDSDDDLSVKVKKSKYRSPEYIIIFDDLSNELKSPALTSLLKKNRHFKAKILVSSQYLNDLPPQSRKQMDNILIFKGQPQKKLDEIYRDFDIAISPEQFYIIYQKATEKLYSFLYIDRFNDTFRRNFNFEFEL